jgi:hypothetical protein
LSFWQREGDHSHYNNHLPAAMVRTIETQRQAKLRCNSSVCRMLPSSRQSHFGHLQDDGPLPASGGWKTLSVSVTDF